jgi:hypothetical protein
MIELAPLTGSIAMANKRDRANGKLVVAVEHASSANFYDVFVSYMNKLYLTAYLLTGDGDMAERCFVAATDTCVNGASVCKGWAQSWARRAIIKNAIKMVSPDPDDHYNNLGHNHRSVYRWERGELLHNVLDLCPFERFVFVMSVLERLSVQDCSLLLGATRVAIAKGRQSAIEHLAEICDSSCAATADASSRQWRTSF